jgi:hypothetical protein
MKLVLITALVILFPVALRAQADTSQLFKTLKANDSLLFNVGFNTCDISQFENLVADTFEFYHDKSGLTPSKQAFIADIKNGLCNMAYKARRELIENTLAVYPLMKNGVLYGALQTGEHRFYAIEKDKPEYLTSTAKFTHIWLLQNGKWKLSRAISYNHVQPVR